MNVKTKCWGGVLLVRISRYNYFPFLPPFLGYMYETAGYAHLRFQVPLRVYFDQHRMACSAIWHLVELCHENRGLSGARTMVAMENDRCRLFEDHVQGELMALMGVDEAAYSTCLLYTSPSPRDS